MRLRRQRFVESGVSMKQGVVRVGDRRGHTARAYLHTRATEDRLYQVAVMTAQSSATVMHLSQASEIGLEFAARNRGLP